jgi:hypothetical protein
LFANKQTFLFHDAEKDCSQSLSSTKEKLIPPFLILLSTYPKQTYFKIFNEGLITHLLKNFKIDDETFSVYFFGSAPFTPYCRDITKGKNVGIRTFISAKKFIFELLF